MLHDELARYLDSLPGWVQAPEVSFSVFGERGVIDILAFHAPSGSLLVIELKTELVSFEDLLSTMDARLRLAVRIAAERGRRATTVSAWVVVAETTPNRRRAKAHEALLRSAFPADRPTMRKWLQDPVGTVRGVSFWPISNASGANSRIALRRRVRHPSRGTNAL